MVFTGHDTLYFCNKFGTNPFVSELAQTMVGNVLRTMGRCLQIQDHDGKENLDVRFQELTAKLASQLVDSLVEKLPKHAEVSNFKTML